MTRKQKRLAVIAAIGLVLAAAIALVLVGLRDKIVFFRSPSEVKSGKVAVGESFRLGGLVTTGSVKRGDDSKVTFSITDGEHNVEVRYQGLLPDLFREGQGVVAEGKLDTHGGFEASTILAKHDENYMPREVADSLKKKGEWRGAATEAQKPQAGEDKKSEDKKGAGQK